MSESESGDDDVYVVEEIRDVKTMDGMKKFLVKWEGYDEESWEPEENILDKTLIKAFTEKKKSGGGGAAAGSGGSAGAGKTPSKRTRKLSDEDFELASESKKKSSQKSKENGGVTRRKRKRVVSEPDLEKSGNKKAPKEEEELVVDGVKPGLEPKDIIGATKLKDQIVFLVKWKEEDAKPSTIYAKDVNEKWPSLVIDFYERHFEWITIE